MFRKIIFYKLSLLIKSNIIQWWKWFKMFYWIFDNPICFDLLEECLLTPVNLTDYGFPDTWWHFIKNHVLNFSELRSTIEVGLQNIVGKSVSNRERNALDKQELYYSSKCSSKYSTQYLSLSITMKLGRSKNLTWYPFCIGFTTKL